VGAEIAYLAAGVMLVGMALAGSMLARAPLSPAMVYLGAGVLLGPAAFGVVELHPIDDAELVERIAEVVVLISLLTAGLKLRTPLRHHRWVAPVLLATVAMALTVGLVTAIGVLALGLPLGAAIVLGAVLAPTDPVLASDVQTADPWDRDRLRFTLTGEAGLNDGTAFPLVLLGIGLLGGADLGPGGVRWIGVDLVWGVAAGLFIGALLGTVVGRVVLHLRRNRQEGVGRDELLALGLLALAYGGAEIIGAYGFLAVFVAGIALRRVEWRETEADDRAPEPHELPAVASDPDAAVRDETAPASMAHLVLRFSEQLERAAEAVAVVVIGVLLLVLQPPLEALWFVPLLLVAVRPLAVLTTLLPLRPRRHDVLLAAWFGIRGVGSMYYLSFALVAGVLAADDAELVTGLVLVTIAASIVLHGISVTPLMARREERKEQEGAPGDRDEAVDDAPV